MHRLARFAIRFRWPIVVFWVMAAIILSRALPSLASVLQASNAQFLPSSSPSQQAAQLAVPFRGGNSAATAILVATRADRPLTSADMAALDRLESAARLIPGVQSVTGTGTSRDGEAAQALVVVTAATANGADTAKPVVDSIRGEFGTVGAPTGLTFHLTGPLAVTVDSSNTNAGAITRLSLLLVVLLLFAVYRAALAPLITLIPAAISVLISGPLIAELAKAGVAVTPVAQQLLIVLLVGAGSDYGLFLAFRFREELAAGREPLEALTAAMARVGEAIGYSALTVAAALLTLLLAPFGIYRGLGPGLALGIGVLLAASLTLTPALLAIFGRTTFWPLQPRTGVAGRLLWGGVAQAAVRRPIPTLLAGLVVFGGLALGLTDYRTAGLTGGAPAGSDSARGADVLAAHSQATTTASDQLLLRFDHPVKDDLQLLGQIQSQLASSPLFSSLAGPLGPGAGRAGSPPDPRFLSPDGRTVELSAVLRAGPAGSTRAAAGIPQARTALQEVAATVGANAYGIAGQDATAYDIYSSSNDSLLIVVPVVLALILVLLALLLRSLVAPWYLALTVGFSFVASLGFASLVFIRLGGADGLIFVLPLIMFVFSMALGEDYNILVMTRIREEAARTPDLGEALTKAIGITGGTVTSAGLILAGTFCVFGLAGGSTQAQQLGFSIAFGVLLDTFFVRTLLVPSIAQLLGRWNWWPSDLGRSR